MKAVDDYIRELFASEDSILASIRERSDQAGLPQIQVPPETGRLLALLVRASGAVRVLEVGALGGYSAVWIARALPEGGSLTTLEIDPAHAECARSALEDAGLLGRAEVRVGEATALMRDMRSPVDLVFLDADKESYLVYLEEAARLLRQGGLVVADNCLWRGEVVSPEPGSLAEHVDRFNRALAHDPRFQSTILPVGDGVAVGVRTEAPA